MVTVSTKELTYLKDKERSETRVFTFNMFWYVITGIFSLYKFATNTDGITYDDLYYLAVFAFPIFFIHTLRLDYYKAICNYKGKYFKAIWIIFNVMYWIIATMIMLFLIGKDMLLTILGNNVIYYYLVFHIITLCIGIYDKMIIRVNVSTDEKKEGNEL